jgi:hypothetical protein
LIRAQLMRKVHFCTIALLAVFGILLTLHFRRTVSDVAGPTAPASPAAKPIPAVEDNGPDWTYEELYAHLRSKGLKFDEVLNHKKVHFLIFAKSPEEAAWLIALLNNGCFKEPIVCCGRYATAKEARDSLKGPGLCRFAWGRFTFEGQLDPAWLAQIQTALTGKTEFQPRPKAPPTSPNVG